MQSSTPDTPPGSHPCTDTDQRQTQRGLEVRIEFVILDGEPGKHLAGRQATIMRKVLQHIAQRQEDHPERRA
jgi:hypothetical protein